MLNFLKSLGRMTAQSFIAAMFVLSAVSMVAFALTVPPNYGPRQFNTQQTGYFRIHVKAGGTSVIVNGQGCGVLTAGVCLVKVGALPANAFVLRINMQIYTNFNSASGTDELGLGTSTSSATPTTAVNLLASTSVHSGAGGNVAQTVVAARAGSTLTTSAQALFGQNGGQDLWLRFNNGSGVGPAAGEATLVLEFISPNDGDCIDQPIGGTPTTC